MRLYTFWRSSAAYRVRIALNLKGLKYTSISKALGKGAHLAADYTVVNPQGLVPALEDDGHVIAQSLAIMEYLDETHPVPPFLPRTRAAGRRSARSRRQSPATSTRSTTCGCSTTCAGRWPKTMPP